MSRADRFIEAARLTGLSRELMERYRFEDQQACLLSAPHHSEEDKARSVQLRDFANEILARARDLSKEADEIYRSLRR